MRANGFLLRIGIFKGPNKVPKCNLPKSIFLYVNEFGSMDGRIMIVGIFHMFLKKINIFIKIIFI